MTTGIPLPWPHLPPTHFLHRAGIRVHEHPGDADAVLEIDVVPDHGNGYRGGVHGGMLATLVDVAAGMGVRARVSHGGGYSTRDLTMHYLANAERGPIRAIARVRQATERTVVLQVDVADADGQICAIGTVSYAIGRPRR